jgi:hypothetical protein
VPQIRPTIVGKKRAQFQKHVLGQNRRQTLVYYEFAEINMPLNPKLIQLGGDDPPGVHQVPERILDLRYQEVSRGHKVELKSRM